jgi:hypothetical protein
MEGPGSNERAAKGVPAFTGELASSSKTSKAGHLPASGNVQLDKYLR